MKWILYFLIIGLYISSILCDIIYMNTNIIWYKFLYQAFGISAAIGSVYYYTKNLINRKKRLENETRSKHSEDENTKTGDDPGNASSISKSE